MSDEAELRGLVEGYAAAVDAGDADAFADLFAEDAVLTTSAGGRFEGRAAIGRIPGMLARYESTDHRVGASSFVVHGDTATGTTACEAHHVRSGVDAVMTITYHDAFVRQPSGWRFATRHVDIERTDEVAL